ncbi:MAG: hypothetical protein Q7U57_01880, partial [Methylovulum sp.]|nr:hypothetical protein [Methylovulum sp.]
RAYASSISLPLCLQGSIPGSWLAITWAGFTPASLCRLARPQRTSNPIIDSNAIPEPIDPTLPI